MQAQKTAPQELTLKDRLSRLTFRQACRLLGPRGEQLIRHGGHQSIKIDEQIYFEGDLFRLKFPDAVVTITLAADAQDRLRWNCTRCAEPCGHVGATFALILEEKMALGLSAPPRERKPVESLSEEELVRRALAERYERTRAERMRVTPTAPDKLWTNYLVYNANSGKTYRVALRGWGPGDSYCTCPDFRKNTLGTCKHIMGVTRYAKKRFSPATRGRRFVPKELAVHVRYGRQPELRLLHPPRLNGQVAPIVKPLLGRAITDVQDLLRRVRKLEALGSAVTVYPDAEEWIEHILFEQRMAAQVVQIRKNPKAHPLRTTLLKAELLPYQLDGIAFAAGAGRAILADDMGLGKTVQGIGVAELLSRETQIRKVLVICPTSLKSQWRNEIHRFSDRDCQLIIGGAAERARQYDNGCFFTICNYEQALRDVLAIERTTWDLIILDEGQRIKNWEAKTSRTIKALRSRFALVLSGTPLENRLDELFSVAEFIDDRRLGPAFRFFNQHRVVDEKGKVLGYKNLAELRRRLAPILLRRTRASVMSELPPRSTEIVRIPPTAEQLGVHRAHMHIVNQIVNKKFITEMDLLRLQKALLMARMVADSTTLVDKEQPGYSSKLERLDELLDQLISEKDRKILLFSEWTSMLNLIEPLLHKRKVKFVRLDGSVPQKQRQTLVNTFQKDPECRLFITTNAGSTGLNLQAADTVINVDLPWNPAVLEQRIARAHRMGQKRPVQVFVLVTEGTLEERLLGTLSAKHELALAVLDPDADADEVAMAGGMDELKRRLEVLLGTVPDAATDESQREDQGREAERLAHQERVSTAGGQLLTAAFAFLGELIPAQQGPTPSQDSSEGPRQSKAARNGAPPDDREVTRQQEAATAYIRSCLADCLTQDEQGRPRLTVTLPDAAALDSFAATLARVVGAAAGRQAG